LSSTRGISVDRDLYVGPANDLRESSQNPLSTRTERSAGPRRVSETGVPVQPKGRTQVSLVRRIRAIQLQHRQPDFSRCGKGLRRGDDAESLLRPIATTGRMVLQVFPVTLRPSRGRAALSPGDR
jgi:hypothetical protein